MIAIVAGDVEKFLIDGIVCRRGCECKKDVRVRSNLEESCNEGGVILPHYYGTSDAAGRIRVFLACRALLQDSTVELLASQLA